MGSLSQEAPAGLQSLPCDVLAVVMSHISARDVATAAQVCRAWAAAADREQPWQAALRRDFPAADPVTLAALHARAHHEQGRQGAAARCVYRALRQRWVCERCQQAFTDADQGPASCCYHPGILFSGGLMNGAGLRYTCCNRRAHHIPTTARDANGCATAFHAGGGSAWQRHGTGVRPRELSAEPASSVGSASSSDGSSPGGSPSRRWLPAAGQEWHPNQRPGLLELPSRLFAVSSGIA